MEGSSQKGLTLVEMLVVMTLVSLVATLLVSGLGNALALYQRVGSNQGEYYASAMTRGWFRSVVAAAVPSTVGKQALEGDSRTLALASFQPLLRLENTNARVSWRLVEEEDAHALEYREGDYSFRLPLDAEIGPSFQYLGEDRNWHDSWPIDPQAYRLPVAIRLVAGRGSVLVTVKAHKQAHYYADVLRFGRN